MTQKINRWTEYYKEMLSSRKKIEFEKEKDEFILRLKWMQHERFVHLIVTVTVLIVLLLLGIIAFQFPVILWIFAIIFVLEIFYLIHYYFLENTVQLWYDLYDEFKLED